MPIPRKSLRSINRQSGNLDNDDSFPDFFHQRMVSSSYLDETHYVDKQRTKSVKLFALITNKLKLFHPATCNLRTEIAQLAMMIQQCIPKGNLAEVKKILKALDQIDLLRQIAASKKNAAATSSHNNIGLPPASRAVSRVSFSGTTSFAILPGAARISNPFSKNAGLGKKSAANLDRAKRIDMYRKWKKSTTTWKGNNDTLAGAASTSMKECVVNHYIKNGNTLLMETIIYNKPEIMKELLTSGSNLKARNNDGHTAILLACKYDRRNMVAMLIAMGATLTSVEFTNIKLFFGTDRTLLSVLSHCINNNDDSHVFNVSAPSLATIHKHRTQLRLRAIKQIKSAVFETKQTQMFQQHQKKVDPYSCAPRLLGTSNKEIHSQTNEIVNDNIVEKTAHNDATKRGRSISDLKDRNAQKLWQFAIDIVRQKILIKRKQDFDDKKSDSNESKDELLILRSSAVLDSSHANVNKLQDIYGNTQQTNFPSSRDVPYDNTIVDSASSTQEFQDSLDFALQPKDAVADIYDIAVASLIGKYMYDKLRAKSSAANETKTSQTRPVTPMRSQRSETVAKKSKKQSIDTSSNSISTSDKKKYAIDAPISSISKKHTSKHKKEKSKNNRKATANFSNLSNFEVMNNNAQKEGQRKMLEDALSTAQSLTESNFNDKKAWVNYFEMLETERTKSMWKNNKTIKHDPLFRLKKRHLLMTDKYDKKMKNSVSYQFKLKKQLSSSSELRDWTQTSGYAYTYKNELQNAIKKASMLKSLGSFVAQEEQVDTPGIYKKTVHGTWILDKEAMNGRKRNKFLVSNKVENENASLSGIAIDKSKLNESLDKK